ncbi:MAG: ATP-dependent DNA helicase [Pseudomonadota bacterium]|nr:MAG: ATP-dependent DNA helicase [Pseudomonadota bacterium]
MLTLSETLGPRGPLAAQIPGFQSRVQQQEMAEAVAEALDGGDALVSEAGTGTGKTFAYLVPAILSGRKVIVSTGTKNLQDQLFHRDLPVVRRALAVPVSVALLKGRANYLCLHRLEQLGSGDSAAGVDSGGKLREIAAWAAGTRYGDIAELAAVAENDPIWARVTSTSESCLAQNCPAFDNCYLNKARREAQAADVVVVNHHLLFADMALRDEGFGELLPAADAFIVDEAHQLPAVASDFFGLALSSNQLLELARDSDAEYRSEINEDTAVARAADALQKAVQDLRLAFGVPSRRAPWTEFASNRDVSGACEAVAERLAALAALLKPLAERSKTLESCHRRATVLAERFELLTRAAPEDHVHWVETWRRAFRLHVTPLDIAPNFRSHMEAMGGAWIFTSATLAVAGDFTHFIERLGIEHARTRCWDSPFDYARQGLCFLPGDMPDPNSDSYTARVIEVARRVITASQGRAFVLFTSYRALEQADSTLRDAIPYPVLVQGEGPRDRLLARFRSMGNAVLLGTSSFWEGVDVRGEALSCVIIDRLPFAAPNDPVLQARIEALRQRGVNPFMAYQVPAAVIALKQGAGRLIRDVNDRGVLVVCDPRLRTKTYGRVFLKSLPPMPRTDDIAQVEQFFAAEHGAAVEPGA